MTATPSPSPVAGPPSRTVLEPVDDSRPDTDLTVDELGSRIVGLAGRLAAATCRWLLLVAEFDARDGCDRFGLPSTARWLSHACSLSRRTAIEHVRVARALRGVPSLAAGMAQGRLSYSQVRAISRVVGPGDDALAADLVDAARHSTAGQLETVVRGLRTVDHNDRLTTAEDYVRRAWTDDSRLRLSARVEPESGAVIDRAITAVARAEGLTAVQALARMAELALVAIADADAPPRALRGDERAAIVVHLDEAGLAGLRDPDAERPAENPDSPEVAGRPPTARIAGGPGLPDRVVRRLLCSGRIRTVVHRRHGLRSTGETVRDLGRSHRVVSDRQFRALLLRDAGGCTHPGCESRLGLEAHHVMHWVDDGPTDLDNLVLLCRAHHHALHDGEFRIATLGGGRFRFARSDARVLPALVDAASLARAGSDADLARRVDLDHAEIAVDAAASRWDGTRLDRHYAVDVLARSRSAERARRAG